MKLSLIDIEKIVTYDVLWVDINTPAGNMVIQQNHVPMIIELLPNHELLFELATGEQKNIIIIQAVAHITRQEVKILIPTVIK